MNLFEADNLEAATALLELHWQFRASRVLMTAHQLGVFRALKEPRTAAEVAAQCSTDVDMTDRLLIACCALGVVRRDNGRFRLSQLARDTLLPESPRYLGWGPRPRREPLVGQHRSSRHRSHGWARSRTHATRARVSTLA